jgi:hypothetical protein
MISSTGCNKMYTSIGLNGLRLEAESCNIEGAINLEKTNLYNDLHQMIFINKEVSVCKKVTKNAE